MTLEQVSDVTPFQSMSIALLGPKKNSSGEEKNSASATNVLTCLVSTLAKTELHNAVCRFWASVKWKSYRDYITSRKHDTWHHIVMHFMFLVKTNPTTLSSQVFQWRCMDPNLPTPHPTPSPNTQRSTEKHSAAQHFTAQHNKAHLIACSLVLCQAQPSNSFVTVWIR